MNPHGLGVDGDAELPRGPVVRVLVAVADRLQRASELGSDLLGSDADVQLARAECTCTHPNIAVESAVQFTHEVVGEQLIEGKRAIEHRRQQFLGDLLLHGLLEVIDSELADRLPKQATNAR